jgi:hypothetical protein
MEHVTPKITSIGQSRQHPTEILLTFRCIPLRKSLHILPKQHYFQQLEFLSRTTCFGTCVPSSGPVTIVTNNVPCIWVNLHGSYPALCLECPERSSLLARDLFYMYKNLTGGGGGKLPLYLPAEHAP